MKSSPVGGVEGKSGHISKGGGQQQEQAQGQANGGGAVGVAVVGDSSTLEADTTNQCECELFGWEGPGHSPACDCWVVGCN